jgi:hypothetical protein
MPISRVSRRYSCRSPSPLPASGRESDDVRNAPWIARRSELQHPSRGCPRGPWPKLLAKPFVIGDHFLEIRLGLRISRALAQIEALPFIKLIRAYAQSLRDRSDALSLDHEVADHFLLEFICASFFIQVSILRFGESRVHFFQGASSYLDTRYGMAMSLFKKSV